MRYFISHCANRFYVLHPNMVCETIVVGSEPGAVYSMLDKRTINQFQFMWMLLSTRETSRADYEYFMERYWDFHNNVFDHPQKRIA